MVLYMYPDFWFSLLSRRWIVISYRERMVIEVFADGFTQVDLDFDKDGNLLLYSTLMRQRGSGNFRRISNNPAAPGMANFAQLSLVLVRE